MDENNTLFIPKGYELKNIYHFETWDRDGKKTGEAYGDNIITSRGLGGWSDSTSWTPDGYFWVGTGSGTPKTTDTGMFNQFYSTTSGSAAYTYYAQEYNPETGIITQKFRLYNNIVIPYNISGVTTDKNITEFGIGQDTHYGGHPLCTHGLIRDEHGEPSYIVKRVNEQMTVTVYISASVHERFYQDLFDNGILGLFILKSIVSGAWSGVLGGVAPRLYLSGETTVPNNKSGSDPYPSYSCVRNGSNYIYGPNDGRVNRYVFNTPDFTIESGLHFETCANWTTSSNAFNTGSALFGVNETDLSIPFRNPESESFAFNYCRTNTWNSEYFDNMFRITYASAWNNVISHGRIPVIDISNLHSYMYNHIDKEWNIEEQIEYEPDVEWRIRNWHVQQQVYMKDMNDASRYVAVFTNDNIDAPIYAFNNSGINLYATDKWWDPQSWSLIEDLSNLDPSQRNARYYLYIWSSGSIVLYPDRHWKKPKYILSQTYNYTPYDDPSTASYSRTFIKCYSEALDVYCSWEHILFHPEGCWGAFDSATNPGTVKSIVYKYPIELTGLTTSQYNNDYSKANCSWHKWIINGFLVLRQERGNATGTIAGSKVHTLLRIVDINGYKNYAGTNLDDNATITDPTTGFVTDVQLELNNQAYNTAAELSIICDLDRLVIWESNAKQCLVVEITRDANDKPVVTQTTMTTSATENYDSWHMWYGQDKLILRKGFTYDIYSLTTKELLRSVAITDIDPDVTSVSTCVGWKDLMYINAANTTSNPRSLYYYDYENDVWSYRLNYYRDTIHDGRMVAYNDECIIFSPAARTDTTASQPCMITADEPEIYHAFTSWDHDNVPIKCIASGDLKYLNDGKQLLMLTSIADINDNGYGFYRPQVWDIGYMIDNRSYNTTWCGLYGIPSAHSNFVGNNQMSCFFNGNIILRTGKNANSPTNILYSIIPITNLINHRLTLTSHTITAFNQPMHFNATTMLESQIGINEDYQPSPGKWDNAGKGSVYLVEIKESNDNDDTLTLLHRYIPCVRNSDNVIGMYDMIDEVFCKSYGDPMTASSDTVTNPEPNFPAEYTQVEYVSVSGDRSSIPLNYVHNHHTVIEWTGTIPTGSTTYRCLFGSSRWSSVEHSMNFYCYGASSGYFEFRRSHTGETGIVGIYDKMIKITASGLVANVLDIDAGTTTAVTCNQGNVMDEGINAMCLFDDSDYTPVEIRNLL